jgi:hypothetical protein
MKRREFLKSSLLLAAVSTVVGKASGIFTNAIAAAGAFPDEGGKFLGFQMDSKHKPVKMCATCKYFKDNKDAGANAGECTLPAMKNAVKNHKKAALVWVKTGSYCNMWQKKA